LTNGGMTVNREVTRYSEKNVVFQFFRTQSPREAVRGVANIGRLRDQKRLYVALLWKIALFNRMK